MTADNIAGWGGWAVGVVTLLFSYIRERRKGDVDESTLILGKWKELVEQHQTDIRILKEEFAVYKQTAIAEIGDLRLRLVHAEGRISELETENAGLKRAIAQNSQSAAFQLSRSKTRATASETRQTIAEARADGVDVRQKAQDVRQKANDKRIHGMEGEISRIDQADSDSKGQKR